MMHPDKEKVEISLFVDDTILYPKDIRTPLENSRN